MSSVTASTVIGNQPELVESILSYLPMRDLLLVQRVSRLFASIIKSSKQLQRNLFLLADDEANVDKPVWKIYYIKYTPAFRPSCAYSAE